MKACPECKKVYYDESLNYCLDDGASLILGPAKDEPATAIFSSDRSVDEAPTRTFEPSLAGEKYPLTDIPSTKAAGRIASTKNSLIAGAFGVLLVTALGLGGYWYYGGPARKQINSIAVLPFQNRSAEPDTEYLSDGLAESLIYRLSQLPNLKVSPTSTVFRYKGNETDPITIGRELAVDAVLSGRIVQRGDNLTISVGLVDVSNNKQLWGEQYDRKMADLLATQREIAREIVNGLALKVSNDEKGLNKQYTENNEAYQLYLKGRFYWNKRNPEALKRSIDYFNQAIEKDPSFALAYAGLADSFVVPANRLAPREAMPKAKAAAMRALQIDDSLAEAHTSLGRVLQVYDWNWKEAESEFKRALELNPRYPVAHQWYGGYLERTGRMDEAISERKLALELDPLSTITNFELGQAFFFARDYDKALEQFEKTLELDPGFPAALQYIPVVYVQKGMIDKAIASVQAAPETAALAWTGVPGYVFAKSGRTKEARIMLDELKRLSEHQYISAVGVAHIYIGLGDNEEALAWLERGYEERSFQMQFLKVDPRYDSLRSDRRFNDLVRQIGFPE